MLEAIDFWLDMGVDGMRLDAIPYLFEREGTSCENLPETHELIRKIRQHVDSRYPDRMLLAEANQWPEDAVTYFGAGDECHMAFHFPIMPRLFMALRMEDRFPVIDILEQTPPIPDSCQWALFLRNHDELTLEMVTDEERDYMWRTHAHDRRARINQGIRRRLAPLLGNSRRRIEVMNSLLMSLPGTPVIYYGDEIGMGDNVYLGDRNGVRTPMQWSSDRNAGFSSANPQALILPVVTDPEYHFQTVNVETQQANPSSLLWWTKRMIALRKQRPVFGSGSMQILQPTNPRVFAFVRTLEGDSVLVVVNFSRFVQYVELDLSEFRGARPRELIGGARFPPVRSKPYPLALGPHTFYWLSLSAPEAIGPDSMRPMPATRLPLPWKDMASGPGLRWFERHLEGFLSRQSWATEVRNGVGRILVEEAIGVPFGDKLAHVLVVLVEPAEGMPVHYVVPMALAEGPFADPLLARFPDAVLARILTTGDAKAGLVHDAMADREFCAALLARTDAGTPMSPARIASQRYSAWELIRGEGVLEPHLPEYRPGATTVNFGDRLTLRLIRRLEPGPQPEEEIRLATSNAATSVPGPQLGAVLRLSPASPPGDGSTIATVSSYVPNFGNAWQYTVDEVARFFDAALGLGEVASVARFGADGIFGTPQGAAPAELVGCMGSFPGAVETMARSLAELHLSLASLVHEESFRPEPYTTMYQRSVYQGIRSAAARAFLHLQEAPVPGALVRPEELLARKREVLTRLRFLIARRINGARIRIHGDMHLGHLLYTGRDFVVGDFAGDPEKPLSQRAIKRSPLRDVAGMISSFHRVVARTLLGELGAAVRIEDLEPLRTWARAWLSHAVSTFVQAYAASAAAGGFLPDHDQIWLLIFAYMLEKQTTSLSRHIGKNASEVEISMHAMDLLSK